MGEEMDLDDEIQRTNVLLDTIAADVGRAQQTVASTSATIDETARQMEDFNSASSI